MEKLVVMGGVGEDEMKGKHVLLTTVRLPECRCSIFSVSQLPKHFVRNVKFSHPPAPKRRVQRLSEESS